MNQQNNNFETHPTKSNWYCGLLVFLIVFGLYLLTLPREIIFQDDGEFVLAVKTLGIAHPPGYPIYVLLAHPFTWLPIGTVAFRVHLASAFFGAVSCGLLFLLLRLLSFKKLLATSAAVMLGISSIFWSQSIIAETYTLNVMLVLMLLILGLKYVDERKIYQIGLMGLLVGIGLSNHWPLFILASPCMLFVLPAIWSELRKKKLMTLIAPLFLLCLGLTPYLWMMYRSQKFPNLGFYGAIPDFSELWFYIKREGYSGLHNKVSVTYVDMIKFCGFFTSEWIKQFTPIGFVIILLGFSAQWKKGSRFFNTCLTLSFLAGSYVLVVLTEQGYERIKQATFSVFPLIPYCLSLIWFAYGVKWIMKRWSDKSYIKPITSTLCAIILLWLLIVNYQFNNRRNYNFTKDYTMTVLNSFAKDSVVFTHSDLDANPLGYYHYIENVRPDITLYNDYGMLITKGEKLFSPRDLKSEEHRTELLMNYIKQCKQPIYFFNSHTPGKTGEIANGFYKQVDLSRKGSTTFNLNEDLLAFYRRIILEYEMKDLWDQATRDAMVAKVVKVLTPMVYQDRHPSISKKYKPDLELGRQIFMGKIYEVYMLKSIPGVTPDLILNLIAELKENMDPLVGKKTLALIYYVEGVALQRSERLEEAKIALKKSIEIYPEKSNEAYKILKSI